MSQMNAKNESTTNMERLKEQASTCEPGCGCNSGVPGKVRLLVGVIIIVIVGVLVVRAVTKTDSEQTPKSDAEFAMPQAPRTTQVTAGSAIGTPDGKMLVAETTVASQDDANKPADKTSVAETETPPQDDADKPAGKPVVCGEMIESLRDLSSKAMDKDGVFVFLAGNDAVKNHEIAEVIKKGAGNLRGRDIKMGVFTLRDGSREYANLIRQIPPPGVLTMVKGRGALAVSDDITESKLMQAFVAAANGGGGCGGGGCGPSGCR